MHIETKIKNFKSFHLNIDMMERQQIGANYWAHSLLISFTNALIAVRVHEHSFIKEIMICNYAMS